MYHAWLKVTTHCAWGFDHGWHMQRVSTSATPLPHSSTLIPLPGACATWHAHRTLRPLAWRTCHVWHARRTLHQDFTLRRRASYFGGYAASIRVQRLSQAPGKTKRACRFLMSDELLMTRAQSATVCHAWPALVCHAWPALPHARRTCHMWHAHRTLRLLPGARATRGTHAARSAPCLAHVPHVACTPHAPPLPGATATRGMHAAGSAPARRMCHTWHHVQHVASHRRRRPLAWIMCHTWHHAARPAPGPANPNQGLPGARCVPHHAWSQKYRHSMRHVWSKCHMWHDLRVPGVADLPPPTR